MSLDELPIGQLAAISSLRDLPGIAPWLVGVGLAPGQHLAVLRRASWGGPLQVRIEGTGEFAVDVELARRIEVTVVAPSP